MQKMQPQVEFKLIALLLLLLQATWCMSSMMRTGKDWNYFNVQHYDSPSQLMDNPAGINNFEYVDYQARCEQGGEPVCATNGRQEFYFENECKLESHNMKSLFQHGTVLERTDLERCSPNCETIKCPTVYQPVCAAPSEAADAVHATTTNGVTFGNLCEVRKHECVSQRAMRIVNQGVCRELKLKRRNRKNRNKTRKPNRVQPSIESEQNSSSNIHFLITTRADRMKAAINSSTTSASTTIASTTSASTTRASTTIASTTRTTSTSFTQSPTKAPMRFREYQYSAAPHVSVSQAENPYNIYNIPDVGKDYENIMDNELSVYVPEVGYVTDSPPSTTTEATTTTTAIITTTPKPTTTTTMAAATTTTTTTLKPTTTTSTTTTPNPKMITTTPKPTITTYIMTISPSPKRLLSSTTSKASTTTKAPSWASSVTTTSQPLQVTTSTTAKSSSVTTTNAPLKTSESTISTKNLNVTTARVEITTTKPKPTTTISSTTSAMTTPLTTTSTITSRTTPSTTHSTTTIATKAKML